MSLRLYCGEYLLHPVPLHWGMNHCSHGCWYCFANLNRAGRRMVNNDLPRIARWFEKGKGPLEYWFLSHGYPMLVSNDSDPFAKSNCDSTKALIELSRLYDFGLCWQTKGGDRATIDMALSGKPTMISVSLTSDNEALVKQMEPGASSYAERLRIIADARAAGHHVVVLLMPFVPGWWDDFPAALQTWHDLGVRHIWNGPLHFSKWQVAAMSPRVREDQKAWIEYGLKHLKKGDMNVAGVMDDFAQTMGFYLYNSKRSRPERGFWEAYFDLGYPFFPTLDGFLRELDVSTGGKEPVVFSFDTFDQWADIGAPGELSIYRDYLQRFARSLRNKNENMRCRDFHTVHEFYWRCFEFPTIFRAKETNIAVDEQGNHWVDEQGRNIMVYIPEGMDEWGYAISSFDDIRIATFGASEQ